MREGPALKTLPCLFCALGLMPHLAAAAGGPKPVESFTLAESLAAHDTLRLDTPDLIVPVAGGYVAWIEGGSLFAALEPEFEARRLVAAEGELAVNEDFASTDGRTLLYRRGAATAAFGPHPATDARELWSVDARGGEPVRLAVGSEVPRGTPVFAPDGRSFVTAEGPILYEYRIEPGGMARRPLLQNDPQHHAALKLGGLAHSPDGSRCN
jgi:hypothetical protein